MAPGVFLCTGFADDTTATRIALAIKRPQATLCGVTAAAHHDLVDEIPGHTDIALASLKTWLARRGASPAALLSCADHFPRARPALQQALEIFL